MDLSSRLVPQTPRILLRLRILHQGLRRFRTRLRVQGQYSVSLQVVSNQQRTLLRLVAQPHLRLAWPAHQPRFNLEQAHNPPQPGQHLATRLLSIQTPLTSPPPPFSLGQHPHRLQLSNKQARRKPMISHHNHHSTTTTMRRISSILTTVINKTRSSSHQIRHPPVQRLPHKPKIIHPSNLTLDNQLLIPALRRLLKNPKLHRTQRPPRSSSTSASLQTQSLSQQARQQRQIPMRLPHHSSLPSGRHPPLLSLHHLPKRVLRQLQLPLHPFHLLNHPAFRNRRLAFPKQRNQTRRLVIYQQFRNRPFPSAPRLLKHPASQSLPHLSSTSVNRILQLQYRLN